MFQVSKINYMDFIVKKAMVTMKYFRKVVLKTISNLQNSLKTNPGKRFWKNRIRK
jgi:hypothetical protein